ncbi:peptidase M23-like protein [Natranaerovirga pectinivora]|uniref:Peptidase M23-like protein n=1 Tax=Natranaerovirga pectinivora TaxID=682400 RepID=A0A4R3MNZ8_9FIRM|nr:M23 family metallopeptidase [Natranaerovirga pectinivora]TCT17005.1 peptidase M23-like protein [Natranaerovirga pectinivora]
MKRVSALRYRRRYMKKFNKRSVFYHQLIRAFCLALIVNFMVLRLHNYHYPITIKNYDLNTIADFHIHNELLASIKGYSNEKNLDFYKILIDTLIQNDFRLLNTEEINIAKRNNVKKNREYKALETIYKMILEDLVYFPIPNNLNSNEVGYYYQDTWLADRSFGGDRLHYGTDIMDSSNIRGYLPLISITDGVVENMGWLEKGGYRIGIRAPSGAYFYYAHLYNYAEGLQIGDTIRAGQLIGFMGDSGYGSEGTIGMFDVHLHLGISLPLEDKNDEFWINPFWVLKYVENNKINSWY